MKHHLTFVLVLILLSFHCFQLPAQELERLGIRGGLNFSRLTLRNAFDENARVGINGALLTRLRFTNWVALQPEITYSTMGARATYALPQFTGDARIQLRYVQLPLMGYLTFFDIFSLHGGPFVSYLVNSNFLAEGTFGAGGRTLTHEDFRSFDLGLAGGLEIHFNSIDIGFRYNRGFINVSGVRPLMGGGNNQVFQVYLTYDLLRIF